MYTSLKNKPEPVPHVAIVLSSWQTEVDPDTEVFLRCFSANHSCTEWLFPVPRHLHSQIIYTLRDFCDFFVNFVKYSNLPVYKQRYCDHFFFDLIGWLAQTSLSKCTESTRLCVKMMCIEMAWKYLYTFACSVVRMKLVSVSTGAVVTTDIVMTKVIAGHDFIVFISTLIYICGQSEKRGINHV